MPCFDTIWRFFSEETSNTKPQKYFSEKKRLKNIQICINRFLLDVLLRTLVLKAFPHCLVSGHHHGFMFKGTSLCIGNKIEIFFWIVAFCSAILGAPSEKVSLFQSRLQISSLPAAIWAWNFASFFLYLTVFLVFYISWYGIIKI